MSVILILIPLSLLVAGLFLVAFIWAVRGGQFEDTCTPSMRVLTDDGTVQKRDGKISTNENGKNR